MPTRSSSFSIKNILYIGFLLALVVSLFFIPEIVQFQGKGSAKKKKITATQSMEFSGVNLDDLIIKKSPSPDLPSLSKIQSMLDGGLLDGDSSKMQSKSTKAGDSASKSEDRVSLIKALSDSKITWQELGKPQVKRAIKDAQRDCLQILKDLPAGNNSVRFALINYINGLNILNRAGSKLLEPYQAIEYIEKLDMEVTQSMLSQSTDSSDFEKWKSVSLGGVFEYGEAANMKRDLVMRFNPYLTLMNVNIVKPYEYTRDKKGQLKIRKNTKTALALTGVILGRDTQKIVVYRNGKRLGTASVGKKANTDGLRVFKYKTKDVTGVYSFQAETKDGQVNVKSYNFYPRATRFRRDMDGVFLIPFQSFESDEYRINRINTRVDGYFRINANGSDFGSGSNGMSGIDDGANAGYSAGFERF